MERSRKRTPIIQRSKGACTIGLVMAIGCAIFGVGGAAAGDGTFARHVARAEARRHAHWRTARPSSCCSRSSRSRALRRRPPRPTSSPRRLRLRPTRPHRPPRRRPRRPRLTRPRPPRRRNRRPPRRPRPRRPPRARPRPRAATTTTTGTTTTPAATPTTTGTTTTTRGADHDDHHPRGDHDHHGHDHHPRGDHDHDRHDHDDHRHRHDHHRHRLHRHRRHDRAPGAADRRSVADQLRRGVPRPLQHLDADRRRAAGRAAVHHLADHVWKLQPDDLAARDQHAGRHQRRDPDGAGQRGLEHDADAGLDRNVDQHAVHGHTRGDQHPARRHPRT